MTTDQPADAGSLDDAWAAALAEQEAAESATGATAAPAAAAVPDAKAPPAAADAGRTARRIAPEEVTVESTGDPSQYFPRLSGALEGGRNDIDMILDIPVQLTVELGRTRIPIKHILQLAQGSVIELDALAGEPMDVLVNGCLIAQGEVVVVNDKFGIRLTDIVTPNERMRRLNRA